MAEQQPQETQAPPAPPNEAPWEPVDVQVVNTPRGRYKIEQRFQPRPQPRERPKPLPVHVPDGGDIEIDTITSGGFATWMRGGWTAGDGDRPRNVVTARANLAAPRRMVPLRRVSIVAVVAVLLAVWLGYVAGHGAGRAEMAREIIRAGVHRLADRPALVDTIEDASGWDADTREAERQRGRDERGR